MFETGTGAGFVVVRSLLLLVLPPMFFASCITYQEVTFKGVTNLQVSRFDQEGVAARAMVTLDNPNNFRIHVIDPDVDLYLNDVYIGKATLDSNIVMDRRSSRTMPFPCTPLSMGTAGRRWWPSLAQH